MLSFLKTLFKGILGIFILLVILSVVFGSDSKDDKETTSDISKTPVSSEEPVKETPSSDVPVKEVVTPPKDTSSSDEPVKEIVSTSFSDFTLYSDSTATELQKENFFNENYQGKYVTWSGTVSSVSESLGSYTVSVKHSSHSLVSDVLVKMRDDQKDKLLQLKEGSKITYTAKMTRYGELLGMSAEDGVIDSTGDTEKSTDISKTPSSSDVPVKEIVTPSKDTSSSDEPVKDTSSSDEPVNEIVSTSFSDFTPYVDSTSTELQKESFFDENYKGKYVKWSGTVSTVSESMGSYSVSVKHSSRSLFSDVTVKMRDDQKDKLLQLKEGSKITYTAKMIRYGELIGMSAEDGVIE